MLIDANFDLKIADFGFAMANEGRDHSGKLSTILGSPGYMAPEMLEGRSYYGDKIDIFALGVVLISMVTKCSPFKSLNRVPSDQTMLECDELYQLFCIDKATFYGRYNLPFSDSLKKLLDAMLNYDPLLRPTCSECINSSWLQSDVADVHEVRQELAARKSQMDYASINFPNIMNRRRTGGKPTLKNVRPTDLPVANHNNFFKEKPMEEVILFQNQPPQVNHVQQQ